MHVRQMPEQACSPQQITFRACRLIDSCIFDARITNLLEKWACPTSPDTSDGMMMLGEQKMARTRIFTDEFKREAVRLAEQPDSNVGEGLNNPFLRWTSNRTPGVKIASPSARC
ncbi:hypothetical protein PTKU46_79740 [Paraburkholderia terrae]